MDDARWTRQVQKSPFFADFLERNDQGDGHGWQRRHGHSSLTSEIQFDPQNPSSFLFLPILDERVRILLVSTEDVLLPVANSIDMSLEFSKPKPNEVIKPRRTIHGMVTHVLFALFEFLQFLGHFRLVDGFHVARHLVQSRFGIHAFVFELS